MGTFASALVYQVVSNNPVHKITGGAGVSRARVQFAGTSRDFGACVAISQAVYDLFDGWTGELPGGVIVLSATVEGDHDGYEDLRDGSDDGYYRVPIDVHFLYRKPPGRSNTVYS